MSRGKKMILNSNKPRTLSLKVPKIHSELSRRIHSVTVIADGFLSFLGDNHLEFADSILTAGK